MGGSTPPGICYSSNNKISSGGGRFVPLSLRARERERFTGSCQAVVHPITLKDIGDLKGPNPNPKINTTILLHLHVYNNDKAPFVEALTPVN